MGKKSNYCIRVVEETQGVNPDLMDFPSLIEYQPRTSITERGYYIDKKGIEELAKGSLEVLIGILDLAGYKYDSVIGYDGDEDHIRSASVSAQKGDYYIMWYLTIHKEL